MISIDTFTGQIPRVLPHLLPDGAASEAIDCDFAMGSLTGIVAPEKITTLNVPATARTLFIGDDAQRNVHYWPRDVVAVRGPVASDRFNRFYWLDGGILYVGNSAASQGEPSGNNKYRVGVPYPETRAEANAVTVSFGGYSFRIFAEDISGVRTSAPQVALAAQVVSTNNYEVVLALTGDYAETMAAPGGMWAIEVTTPSDNGILRQAGSPLPSKLPAVLKNYATSLAVRGSYIELRIFPVLRNIAHREYVYTYVNQYGEESAPSEAAGIEVPEDGAVRLVLKGHTNDKGYCPVSRIRLYRAETGTNTTSWLYHSEYANAETVVIEDTLPGSALGAPIQTVGFYPPGEGLETLAVMANGMMVTSRGNQVYISEQYLPYAWSPENTQVTQGRVVGLCAAEGGMYVTTTSHPYFLSGQSPDACTLSKVTSVQAGISRSSICNVGEFVVWASHDGLVMARGVNVSLDWSHKFFTREAWRATFGERMDKMRLNAHDGNLLVWFTDNAQGMLIRFDGEALSMTRLSRPISAAYVDSLSDSLFILSVGSVLEFKGAIRNQYDFGQRLPYVWHSKDFIQPRPTNLGVVRVLGRGAVLMDVFADGKKIHTERILFSANTEYLFRLPAGFLARTWSFGFAGQAESMIDSVRLAGVPSELRGG